MTSEETRKNDTMGERALVSAAPEWGKRLEKESYRNWVKVGYGIYLTSDGIRPYAVNGAKEFHSDLLRKAMTPCSCVYLPIRKPNPYHDMQICDWAKELKQHHTKKKPTWSQSDGKKWNDQNDGYWEVAKLFMPFGCASEIDNAEHETDTTAILNLLLHCDHFTDFKTDNLLLIKNLKSTRNRWAHAGQQELNQKEMDEDFAAMKDLLGKLSDFSEATEALNKVIALENTILIHTEDEEINRTFGGVAFSELCQKDTTVVEELGLLLDRKSNVVSYFRHLADKLKAPPEVKASCESNREFSCTEKLLKLPTVGTRQVRELIEALKKIKRNDMANTLSRGVPAEEDREKTITEVLIKSDKNERLMASLKTGLDRIPLASVKNWYGLGRELGVDTDSLDLINRGSNPTELLLIEFAYKNYVDSDKLKVGWLRKQMAKERLDRPDIVRLLNNLGISQDDQRPLKEVFKPDSEEMWKLCVLLNKDNCGATKCWKHLAAAWGIEHEKYSSLDTTKRISPTAILFDWFNTSYPDVAVRAVLAHLESIRRRDARDKLKEKLKVYIQHQQQKQ